MSEKPVSPGTAVAVGLLVTFAVLVALGAAAL
jgi:hypothetical protein